MEETGRTPRLVEDLTFAAVLLVLSVVAFIDAGTFVRSNRADILGPSIFPQTVSVVLGLCALVVIVQGVRRWRRADGGPGAEEDRPGPVGGWRASPVYRTVAVAVAAGLYLVGLYAVGFILSTAAFVAVALVTLGRPGRRSALAAVITAVAVPGLLYVAFVVLLGLELP